MIDTEPDIADKPGAVEVGSLRGDIIFGNVSFGYDDNRSVLQEISLKVNAGDTIAFVGPSGAGKTTICSLLPRFYDVTGGSISIDGIDIRDMKLNSLRKQIGIVQQDVFLFSGTIRENIAYGKLDAELPEIWEAAKRAHLEELISSLPDGMDTVIGERGVKLSGDKNNAWLSPECSSRTLRS